MRADTEGKIRVCRNPGRSFRKVLPGLFFSEEEGFLSVAMLFCGVIPTVRLLYDLFLTLYHSVFMLIRAYMKGIIYQNFRGYLNEWWGIVRAGTEIPNAKLRLTTTRQTTVNISKIRIAQHG